MTAAEFSKKYGIPYSTVHTASFRTISRQDNHWRRQDYSEPELKKAVKDQLEEALEYHKDRIVKIGDMLASLGVEA